MTIAVKGTGRQGRAHPARVIAVAGVLVIALSLFSFVPVTSADASPPGFQSSISVYLNCPGAVTFALPGSTGSCPAGNYTGVYTGASELPIANLTSAFYLSGFTGGIKVTFSLTDVTSGNLTLSGVGYGAMNGGTCTSPTRVVATKFTPTSNAIGSGDTLRVALNITSTGTGTPAFCSGGSNATLISFSTSVQGTGSPFPSDLLTPSAPVQATIGGFVGVSETYTNTGSSPITALVHGVVKNQAGATIDVLSAASITLTPGASVTAFLPLNPYPTGTYTVTTIALTITFVPISSSAVAEISV